MKSLTKKQKEEIKFWEKMIKVIQRDYGKPHCKVNEISFNCVQCRANLVISWIKEHIELIKYK